MKWLQESWGATVVHLMTTWQAFWRDRGSNKLLVVMFGLYGLVLVGVWWLSGGWPQSFWGRRGGPADGQNLPPEFPLFYSLPRGEEQLAVMSDLWLGVIGLGLVILADLALAILLMKKFQVLAYAILWTAILSIVLWGFSVVRIYLLVG